MIESVPDSTGNFGSSAIVELCCAWTALKGQANAARHMDDMPSTLMSNITKVEA